MCVEQIKRTKYTFESMAENITDVIRGIETSTPPIIANSLRGFDVRQGYETYDGPIAGVGSGREKYSVSPEGMAPQRLHSGLGHYQAVRAVEVGSSS